MAAVVKSETEFGRSLKLKLNLGSVRRRKAHPPGPPGPPARRRKARRMKARQRRVRRRKAKDAGAGARCTNAGGGLKCKVNTRGCNLSKAWLKSAKLPFPCTKNCKSKGLPFYHSSPKTCKKFYKGGKIEW